MPAALTGGRSQLPSDDGAITAHAAGQLIMRLVAWKRSANKAIVFSSGKLTEFAVGLSLTKCIRARRLGMKLEWTEDGVKTIMGPIPAIKLDIPRQRKIWFNSMVAAYTGWKDARNDPVKAVTFGDGSPLPSEVIHDCLKILEEECVAIPWIQGDILLLDNWAVLHARRSFDPPRRILASLCK